MKVECGNLFARVQSVAPPVFVVEVAHSRLEELIPCNLFSACSVARVLSSSCTRGEPLCCGTADKSCQQRICMDSFIFSSTSCTHVIPVYSQYSHSVQRKWLAMVSVREGCSVFCAYLVLIIGILANAWLPPEEGWHPDESPSTNLLFTQFIVGPMRIQDGRSSYFLISNGAYRVTRTSSDRGALGGYWSPGKQPRTPCCRLDFLPLSIRDVNSTPLSLYAFARAAYMPKTRSIFL
ncbi:hypothetical protein CALVIDRAFT_187297 [Calocera viscosa TUFC12733]|uniref:Uncharacterized protein n=1 Tax=Calocera viscosa (strain TUFC12733) TaxID=1330018 RepID=A0A167KUP8_CALVF|nr:hypothetical protein CALVIDRAFT_187297 [Calocera viscosa TUFC12733]